MRFENVSLPQVYLESSDFRFFIRWIACSLSKIKYDTEHFLDLYDPLKCPADLLWLLGDTMGFKYDDRFGPAFNRAVLLYFMSMIRHKGSKTGMTLAAEANLKQFDIYTMAYEGYVNDLGEEVPPNEMLWNRLEDTTLPVNAVTVIPHTDEGYIDVVYFSTEQPVDACTEYVRPLGMFMFSYAGVKFDARTKISIDARLATNEDDGSLLGAAHVGQYRRSDYASIQQVEDSDVSGHTIGEALEHGRYPVWYRNSVAEGPDHTTYPDINPGYRALYSLQLSNNAHVVRSLMPGVPPEDLREIFHVGYLTSSTPAQDAENPHNLIYSEPNELYDNEVLSQNITTTEGKRMDGDEAVPLPAVNKVMRQIGDALDS